MSIRAVAIAVTSLMLWLPAARCDEAAGQAKLDEAIDLKISAESVSQLGEVIRLAKEAIDEGLDADNKPFAEQLLASCLIQRGGAFAEAVLRGSPRQIQSPQQYRQLRAMAMTDLEQAIKIDEKQPHAWYLIGRLESTPGGDHERAIAAFDKALEIDIKDTLLRARALTGRALLLEDPAKQSADLDEAVKLAPDEVETVRARGMFLADQKKYDEAKRDLQKAVELEPGDALNEAALAAVLAEAREYDEALAHYNKAIELEPEAAQLYNQRARVHLLQGKASEAIEDLDKTLELVPDQPMALLLRANALHALGDRDRAMADVERVLKENNDFTPALRMRGMLLADSGKLKEAIESLRTASEATPNDVELLLQMAAIELASKDPEGAVRDYTRVLEQDADNWLAKQGRADAYLGLGKHQEALTDYEAAYAAQPKNPTVLNNLSWLLSTSPNDELRDGARAVELAKTACEVTEYKQAHILSTLAAGYAESGDWDKAVEWSTKSVELADARQKEALSKELESYKQKKPWRESIASPLPAAEGEAAAGETESNDGQTAASSEAEEAKP